VSIKEERFVLSVILNNPDSYWEVSSILQPSDFTLISNAHIYSAIKSLLENNQDIDIVSISNSFDKPIKKTLEKEAGDILQYLQALKESPYSKKNLLANAEKIKLESVRRQLGSALENMSKEVSKLKVESIDELVGICDERIIEIGLSNSSQTDDGQVGKNADDFLTDRVVENRIQIGFKHLDNLTGGFAPGQLTVVAAVFKTGKSTILWNWALWLARAGCPVLYLDTEMTLSEQQARALANMTGISEKKITNGLCNPIEKMELTEAIEELKGMPFYHVYLPTYTNEQIVNIARKYRIQKGVKIIFFDYIKVPEVSNQEWLELGYLTNTLKNKVAGALEVPVITAAQLNRSGINTNTFTGEEIAGSIKILHLANHILYLRYKSKSEREKHGRKQGNMILKMAFSRNCPTGLEFYLNFQKPVLRITEVGINKESYEEIGEDFELDSDFI
jgi:replicative DNA helicase